MAHIKSHFTISSEWHKLTIISVEAPLYKHLRWIVHRFRLRGILADAALIFNSYADWQENMNGDELHMVKTLYSMKGKL